MLRPHRTWPLSIAVVALLASGCSSDSSSRSSAPPSDPSTSTAQTTTATEPTTDSLPPAPAEDVTSTASADSGVATTEEPSESTTIETEAAVPSTPWSNTAAMEDASILAAMAGSGDTTDVLTRLFGNPLQVALPADAVLAAAYVTADRTDDGFDVNWRFSVDTATDVAALEASLSSFADDRFEAGVRVESTLESGVFVTLNYPATSEGTKDGWATSSFTVGPETSNADPARPNELEIQAEQHVDDELQLAAFLLDWLNEMPVAEGLTLESFRAELVRLSTDSVNLTAEYSADAGSFDDIVAYYAADHTEGALVLDANLPTEELTNVDRFNAGFFPTLAGYAIGATVTRDLADPTSPVSVELYIRIAPQA